MYRKCTTEKAAAQQRQFQKALLSSMKNQSYSKITVTELCWQTGLSRKTFYRLYENKDDVLCAMLDSLLYDMSHYQEPKQTVSEELFRVFSYWKEQKVVLDVLSRDQLSYLLLERALYYVSGEDTQLQRVLNAAEHSHKEELLLFVLGGIMALIIRWHHSGYTRSTEEMAQIAARLLLRPPLREDIL